MISERHEVADKVIATTDDLESTGVTDVYPSTGGKWLELLKEIKPNLTRVALLFDPDFPNEATMMAIAAAAAHYGVRRSGS